MKGIIIAGALLIAAVIFWLAFWVLAPFIAGLVPVSEWKPLIDFVIYALVAWGGGIAFPIFVVVLGVGIVLEL